MTGGTKAGLRERLQHARCRTDELFKMISPDAIWDRPIPERHRILFYLGHLEAFDWNLLAVNTMGLERFHPSFDELFAFGIDPVEGELPSDKPSDWPGLEEVRAYNRRVRTTVDEILEQADLDTPSHPWFRNGQVFHVALEHRLEHAETLAFMLHWLPYDKKEPRGAQPVDSRDPARRRQVRIPEGMAVLGRPREQETGFGWDNEYERHAVSVPAFAVDSHNVTNGDFLEFIREGGYRERSFWSPEDWIWKEQAGLSHPHSWKKTPNGWLFRGMFEEYPLPPDTPAYVSLAEARAYAAWAGARLPTEAQFHRAAYGSATGAPREYPWGNEAPDAHHGNFDFRRWDPVPVGSFPAGDSAYGVSDLVGNGWEWTSTLFRPFDGFEPFPFYPRYSANFFDEKHYVIKGGSARTGASMLRSSFRNWFQGHYPYIYTSFRLVHEAA